MDGIIQNNYTRSYCSSKEADGNGPEHFNCTDIFKKVIEENQSTTASGLKGLTGKTLEPDQKKSLAATAAERKNFVIGQRTYIFKEGKAGGVEPKFMAKKTWSEKDTAKLADDPDHKYHTWAKGKLTEYRKLGQLEGYEEIADEALLNHPHIQNLLINDINKVISGEIQDEKTKIIFQKFIKTHFVKLDYNDPKLGEMLTRPGMVTTTRNVNLGAVKEALANDLYTLFGVPSQKLTLVESNYTKGQPKLLLKGTEIRGDNGEKFHDFSKNIPKFGSNEKREAYLDSNHVVVDGKAIPIDTQELANLQMVTLLLGDRDKFGSEGKNVGFIISQEDNKAHIRNIDPGKSLEEGQAFCTDRMNHKNLASDGSFTQPNQPIENLEHLYYKNLTLATDTTLSEKIHAMNQILDKYGEALVIVNQYVDKFGGTEHADKKDTLNFLTELSSTKNRLINRIEEFKAVFGNRLDMTPEELDLLDNFEKLTSETVSTATFGTPPREVKLQHLKKVQRVEWQMHEDKNGNCVFSSSRKVPGKSTAWISSRLSGVKGVVMEQDASEKITITIPKNQVDEVVKERLTEEQIRTFKGS